MFAENTHEVERRYELIEPVRDSGGRLRFREQLEIVQEIHNRGRRMFLVRFGDGGTTCLFPHELTPPVERPA